MALKFFGENAASTHDGTNNLLCGSILIDNKWVVWEFIFSFLTLGQKNVPVHFSWILMWRNYFGNQWHVTKWCRASIRDHTSNSGSFFVHTIVCPKGKCPTFLKLSPRLWQNASRIFTRTERTFVSARSFGNINFFKVHFSDKTNSINETEIWNWQNLW